jgi:hypothetical protein
LVALIWLQPGEQARCPVGVILAESPDGLSVPVIRSGNTGKSRFLAASVAVSVPIPLQDPDRSGQIRPTFAHFISIAYRRRDSSGRTIGEARRDTRVREWTTPHCARTLLGPHRCTKVPSRQQHAGSSCGLDSRPIAMLSGVDRCRRPRMPTQGGLIRWRAGSHRCQSPRRSMHRSSNVRGKAQYDWNEIGAQLNCWLNVFRSTPKATTTCGRSGHTDNPAARVRRILSRSLKQPCDCAEEA